MPDDITKAVVVTALTKTVTNETAMANNDA